jgi:hypothetical protein
MASRFVAAIGTFRISDNDLVFTGSPGQTGYDILSADFRVRSCNSQNDNRFDGQLPATDLG